MLHVTMNEQDMVHIRGDRGVPYPMGTPVRFHIDPQRVRFFHPETDKAIGRGIILKGNGEMR